MSSPQTWQLHDWLDRVEAGDVQAREELLRSVGDRLERLARKMLRGFPSVQRWADTGDVLQASLLRLLRALREVRPNSMREFFGLAAEQMRRELLDLARYFERAGAALAEQAATPPEQLELPAPQEDAGELELWACFHEAVQRLPDQEREVLSLLFYHGWSQPQVAQLFGLDERTIRRRWRAACLHLQQMLDGRFPSLGTEP
jgi:RNA polymerase sigma-70 factor (ECF subfamily)